MCEPTYVKANSGNLPAVDAVMVAEFMRNDERFNITETRSAKAASASRESYGDSAIGYVQLRRDGSVCTLKGKVCPEHKIRSKAYTVSLLVNENEERIEDVQCVDCAASAGGCKHAIAFLMWVHRRSEDPSPTEITSYWVKPLLAGVGTTKKFIETKEFLKRKQQIVFNDNSTFRDELLSIGQQYQLDSQLSRVTYDLKHDKLYELSLHRLLQQYFKMDNTIADGFLTYARNCMKTNLCEVAEVETRGQSDSPLWHELRFGRITASKLYEAAHCKTPDGTYVETVIGAFKLKDNRALKRGRLLEKEVLAVIEQNLKVKLRNCGFFLMENHPAFGASPDAMHDDFVVEIKCPSGDKAVLTYIKNDQITSKFKAQLHFV